MKNKKLKYKAIIFDLDGTILYTLDAITNAVNYALRSFLIKEVDNKIVREKLGNGGKNLIKSLIYSNNSSIYFNDMYNTYTSFYNQNFDYKTSPYKNVIDVLKYLKNLNILTAIISNKQDKIVQTLSKKYFNNLIDYTKGQVDNLPIKPDTYHVDIFLSKYNLNKEDVLFIGDSEVDYKTSLNSNIDYISVSWGYRDIDFLKKHNIKNFIYDFLDLKEVIYD